MANALIHQKSPYLQQHAHNPVDWMAWGDEALAKAKAENKPLLVSIGYATCHWCHVMEHESFENEATAEILNRYFVAIKIDREERPDLDRVFMESLQAMGKGGGWPLNAFCTPEGVPFFGGTYFPDQPRYGLPSFAQLLETLGQNWRDREGEIRAQALKMEDFMGQMDRRPAGKLEPIKDLFKATYLQLKDIYDSRWGGFSFHPTNKFPSTLIHEWLLAHAATLGEPKAQEMVVFSQKRMLAGGIFDQVGGGLARYSTDPDWLVPHFEKMLYDNALLATALIQAWRVSGAEELKAGAWATFEYMLRDLGHPEGAFYSAEDADSEGVEGKFYLWSTTEMKALLEPEEFELVLSHWGTSEEGNFEGANLLHQAHSLDKAALEVGQSPQAAQEMLGRAQAKLLAARALRPRPLRDEKLLCSWNALAIEALALGSLAFEDGNLETGRLGPRAVQAGQFIWEKFRDEKGLLHRRYMEGQLGAAGFVNDYAQLGVAYLALFRLTWSPLWLERALELAEQVESQFKRGAGGYFEVRQDQGAHLSRGFGGHDGVEPSGNSAVARLFAELAGFGFEGMEERVRQIGEAFADDLNQGGTNLAYLLTSLGMIDLNPRQLVLAGDADQSWLRAVEPVLPFGMSLLWVPPDLEKEFEELLPLARGKLAEGGAPRAYLCQQFACQAAQSDLAALLERLR
ncbi:MAG: thioredoxin domain-containing protein [bacterium]|nr:thioredoxin domain-containing protein [bacterium]